MPLTLRQVVEDMARGIELADSRCPVARSTRDGHAYQQGIGPHSESQTLELISKELSALPDSQYFGRIHLQVPYLSNTRTKCDVCIGQPPEWEWAIEVKMLRIMGDNGKPNDNMLMHILSPYPDHRSALTDCEKLTHELIRADNKAIIIYGYECEERPILLAVNAFETLAAKLLVPSSRVSASFGNLMHPIHREGSVFGWELRATQ